jgi:ring-1,2-phenylacetyl-CoA epoxidase subunit PaaD
MTRDEVLDRLKAVDDPEIPGLSIVDMGMVTAILVTDGDVRVTLRPTYIGCPALDVIRTAVERALKPARAWVAFDMTAPWSTEDVTAKGKDALKAFGIAPPRPPSLQVECPECGSENTRMTSPFGSTLCRAVYYCEQCHVPFEAWKTV